MSLDLRRLEFFLAVAEHQSMTRAAAAVHVAQPSLSQAIRELEQELGAELFHRLGRQTVLTSAGEALLGPARQAFRDVEVGRAAVAEVAGLEAGRLELAALPTLVADPLAQLVGRFRAEHPQIEVVIVSSPDPAALVRRMQSGEAEVGLTEAGTVPDSLEAHRLDPQDLLAVFPPGRAPDGTRVSLALLSEQPLVTTPKGTSSRRLLEETFAAAGVSPHIAVTTAQSNAVVSLVVAGAGVALLPRPLAELAAALGAEIRNTVPRVRRQLVLVHRSGPLSPAARALLSLAGSAR